MSDTESGSDMPVLRSGETLTVSGDIRASPYGDYRLLIRCLNPVLCRHFRMPMVTTDVEYHPLQGLLSFRCENAEGVRFTQRGLVSIRRSISEDLVFIRPLEGNYYTITMSLQEFLQGAEETVAQPTPREEEEDDMAEQETLTISTDEGAPIQEDRSWRSSSAYVSSFVGTFATSSTGLWAPSTADTGHDYWTEPPRRSPRIVNQMPPVPEPKELPLVHRQRLAREARRFLFRFPGNGAEWDYAIDTLFGALRKRAMLEERYIIFNEFAREKAITGLMYQAACEKANRWPHKCEFPKYKGRRHPVIIRQDGTLDDFSKRPRYWPDGASVPEDPWTAEPDDVGMVEL